MTQDFDISFNVDANVVNRYTMGFDILVNNQLQQSCTPCESPVNLQFTARISLPSTVRIIVYDKDENNDTFTTEDNIVIDKRVIVTNIRLGNILVQPATLRNVCKFVKLDNTTADNTSGYFGFNGTGEIRFDCNDPIEWHIRNRNVFPL